MSCPNCNPWGSTLAMSDGHLADCSLRPASSTFPGKMAGARDKYYCEACDNVKKAPGSRPLCQFCREPMRNMGKKWPVGRKGHRVPLLGDDLHVPSHAEVLLAKLDGTYEEARKHWPWGWYR